uniref:Ovule protein n=1 Tax=Brugia timori TaxID=42155 RepID=A0A0R3QTF9_9BILA
LKRYDWQKYSVNKVDKWRHGSVEFTLLCTSIFHYMPQKFYCIFSIRCQFFS